jgi:hypothetical protein
MAFFWAPGCSLRFPGTPGAELDDTWDDALREIASRSGFTWRLIVPTWGVDVDELACPLHQPTVCSCQARGQSLLLGVVLSCHCSRRGGFQGM